MSLARRTGYPVGLALLLATARILFASDELSRPSGTFTMEALRDPGQVVLELRRSDSRGSRSVMSHVCSLGDLRPLSSAELNGSGPISFTLVRDAGTLVFEGKRGAALGTAGSPSSRTRSSWPSFERKGSRPQTTTPSWRRFTT